MSERTCSKSPRIHRRQMNQGVLSTTNDETGALKAKCNGGQSKTSEIYVVLIHEESKEPPSSQP